MLDFNNSKSRIGIIDQEDRALLRSNPSAWSMPEDGQEHMVKHILLSSRSSFGLKAINLLSWCFAPTKAKHIKSSPPVGHMSVLYILLLAGCGHRIEHTDICPTGVVFLISFTLVGAEHQLRRFIALRPKDER